jgi:hypothetical protein
MTLVRWIRFAIRTERGVHFSRDAPRGPASVVLHASLAQGQVVGVDSVMTTGQHVALHGGVHQELAAPGGIPL